MRFRPQEHAYSNGVFKHLSNDSNAAGNMFNVVSKPIKSSRAIELNTRWWPSSMLSISIHNDSIRIYRNWNFEKPVGWISLTFSVEIVSIVWAIFKYILYYHKAGNSQIVRRSNQFNHDNFKYYRQTCTFAKIRAHIEIGSSEVKCEIANEKQENSNGCVLDIVMLILILSAPS